jgi:predicted RNase H-like HicB family nuclease
MLCLVPLPRATQLTALRATLTLVLVKRKFHVTLLEHEEGVSVSCPELPGCHSQGASVEEALENIEDAIRGYIDLYGDPETRCEIREMEVVTA